MSPPRCSAGALESTKQSEAEPKWIKLTRFEVARMSALTSGQAEVGAEMPFL